MKKSGFWIGIFLVILVGSGCAAGIVGKIPKVDDHFATVAMARKAGFIGCGRGFLICLNDEDFIRLDCGMKTQFKVPAGEKIKISSVSSFSPDIVVLEPVKGETYYFGMDCNYFACWFAKMSKEDYAKIAETCTKDLMIEQGK